MERGLNSCDEYRLFLFREDVIYCMHRDVDDYERDLGYDQH